MLRDFLVLAKAGEHRYGLLRFAREAANRAGRHQERERF